jgi:hypothetical protein
MDHAYGAHPRSGPTLIDPPEEARPAPEQGPAGCEGGETNATKSSRRIVIVAPTAPPPIRMTACNQAPNYP